VGHSSARIAALSDGGRRRHCSSLISLMAVMAPFGLAAAGALALKLVVVAH
jgi:hypothetical protein